MNTMRDLEQASFRSVYRKLRRQQRQTIALLLLSSLMAAYAAVHLALNPTPLSQATVHWFVALFALIAVVEFAAAVCHAITYWRIFKENHYLWLDK